MVMTEVLKSLQTNEELRQKLQTELKYLIVDEYQDVNPVQERLIEIVNNLGANICVVGDDDQTIYQWRGSQIENILNFEKKYDNVRSIKLEDNFRSSKAVVELAMRTIKNNQKRLADKNMNPAGDQAYERGDILCNVYADRDEEDQAIIDHIRKLRGTRYEHKGEVRGIDYSDFCILLRTWSRADSIIDKLKKTDIPFIVTGVNNLFETAEIKAALQIFHFLAGNIDASLLKAEWQAAGFNIPEAKWQAAQIYLEKQIPKAKTFYADFCLQEIYQEFLEKADIREDNSSIGALGASTHEYSRSEVVFYNLGMLSNVIDDYETINFTRPPQNKLNRFLGFVKYAADDFYPEGWLTNTYKTPNAVQIMTVFQAKGLEFPVVFVPGLNKNYLPIKAPGGTSVWSFLQKKMSIDPSVVKGYERYKGGIEDERRLFYVAITRAEKFLFLSRAPVQGNQLYQKESQFLAEIADSPYFFSSKDRSYDDRAKATPSPRSLTSNIFLNFSILKDFFECPYRFKLTTLYGFSQPLNVRVGYGKSLHDILMEIHREVLAGKDVKKEDLKEIVARHFHLPHAHAEVVTDMTHKAERITERYYDEKSSDFKHIEFAEKDIELNLGNGIIVNGRIDLVKKRNTDGTIETTIIDFKSKDDVQTTNISMEQLSLYALGYQTLTGEKADFLEIFNMDAVADPTKRASHKEELRPERLINTKDLIVNAAGKMRANEYEKTKDSGNCAECYKRLLCSGAAVS